MLAAQLIGQGYTDNPYVQSKEEQQQCGIRVHAAS